jgi:RNA polymerase sigma-70 factor (ECF subfamily)
MAEAAQTAGAFEEGSVLPEPQLAAELYARTEAAQYGLTSPDFAAILQSVAQKYLAPGFTPAEMREFCSALRLDELVLARSCAAGNEKAWEVFLTRYREKLYDMALRVAREDSAARDIADSIYAELYGLNARGDLRASKLLSYSGRGSLEGWLRTVISQEFVNRYRKNKRFVSLDEGEDNEEGGEHRHVQELAAPLSEPAVAPEVRLVAATDETLAALAPDERFILAAYHLDGRTLAQIAQMLNVHESTISRKLDKLSKSLRKQILSAMMARGMSRRQAEEALEVDVRDINLNLRARLQDSGGGTFFKKKGKKDNELG